MGERHKHRVGMIDSERQMNLELTLILSLLRGVGVGCDESGLMEKKLIALQRKGMRILFKKMECLENVGKLCCRI